MIVRVILMLIFASVAFGSIYIPPDPPLPIGWEKNRAIGFEPSIELSIEESYHFQRVDAMRNLMQERMEQWGPEAIPILSGYYDTPQWSDFHPFIAAFLGCSNAPEASEWGNLQLRKLLRQESWQEGEVANFTSLYLAYADRLDEATVQFAQTRFIEIATDNAQDTRTYNINAMLTKHDKQVHTAFLKKHSYLGKEMKRNTCLQLLFPLNPDQSLRAAIILCDETQDPAQRTSLIKFLQQKGDYLRAREEMRDIVEEEERAKEKAQ